MFFGVPPRTNEWALTEGGRHGLGNCDEGKKMPDRAWGVFCDYPPSAREWHSRRDCHPPGCGYHDGVLVLSSSSSQPLVPCQVWPPGGCGLCGPNNARCFGINREFKVVMPTSVRIMQRESLAFGGGMAGGIFAAACAKNRDNPSTSHILEVPRRQRATQGHPPSAWTSSRTGRLTRRV